VLGARARSAGTALVTGIDLPQAPIDDLRERLEAALGRFAAHPSCGEPRIVAFACTPEPGGADLHALDNASTATFSLLCAAQLPPSFVEYALRAGADGILVAGCRTGDCAFRLGDRWTEERLAATREPHLRASVPRDRIRITWCGVDDAHTLARALEALRGSLATTPRLNDPLPKRVELSYAQRD